MSIVLPALAVAFGAFCVWLAVRVINRRERWLLNGTVSAIFAGFIYLLGIGPVTRLCWVTYTPRDLPRWLRIVATAYEPVTWMVEYGPDWAGELIGSYCSWWTSF